jgi:hypothetical protein
MTDEEIKAARARLADAPLYVCTRGFDNWRGGGFDNWRGGMSGPEETYHRAYEFNEAFVPRLLDEVERLRGMKGPVDALERVLELEAEVERMRPVYEAALEWATSTRTYKPDGDDEALQELQLQAQNAFNAAIAKEPGDG